MEQLKRSYEKLAAFKYPLLILIVGLVLMLIPGRSAQTENAVDGDLLLQQILSCSEGVGEARVLVSDSGVVVVCQGAENAKVRLDILQAVRTYTGFASDKITVLKMAD